jgi:PLD-like domain
VRKKELEKKINLIPTILSKNLLLESELKSEEQQSKIDETRKDLISLKSSLKSMISEESNKTRQELILIVSTHLSNPNPEKEVGPANIISIQDCQEKRLDKLENKIIGINNLAQINFKESVKEIQDLLNENWKLEFGFITDRKEGRKKFIEALIRVDKRLVMVCPWLSHRSLEPRNENIDEKIKDLIEKALKRGASISIGWGYLDDMKDMSSEENFLRVVRNRKPKDELYWKYSALSWLEEKAKENPGKLELKILGTHAKYLICDDKFIMIGSHNFMTSSDASDMKEFGIVLNDSQIISQAISKFDDSRQYAFNSSKLPNYKGITNPIVSLKTQKPQEQKQKIHQKPIIKNTDDTIPL